MCYNICNNLAIALFTFQCPWCVLYTSDCMIMWSYRIFHTESLCCVEFASKYTFVSSFYFWIHQDCTKTPQDHLRAFKVYFCFRESSRNPVKSLAFASPYIFLAFSALSHFCIVLLFCWTLTEAAYRKNISLRYSTLPAASVSSCLMPAPWPRSPVAISATHSADADLEL